LKTQDFSNGVQDNLCRSVQYKFLWIISCERHCTNVLRFGLVYHGECGGFCFAYLQIDGIGVILSVSFYSNLKHYPTDTRTIRIPRLRAKNPSPYFAPTSPSTSPSEQSSPNY